MEVEGRWKEIFRVIPAWHKTAPLLTSLHPLAGVTKELVTRVVSGSYNNVLLLRLSSSTLIALASVSM